MAETREFDFEQAAREPTEPRVLSVGELTERIKAMLGGLGHVAVEGEVTGLKRASSGHVYFGLKDRARGVESVLNCVLWRSRARPNVVKVLAEGAKLVAHGTIDVYAPRGSYSLQVERLEQRGIGAMLAELEALKAELRGHGWFDRHRPLPAWPRTIGVATSRDGAAFQDFLRTRSLRWPLYPVRLAHTPVQGPGASAAIADAIGRLDASGVDLIVVCRGGGSLEDLWAFNERPVAEAIWRARVPVVSGVGHESDTTLADLVADHRAHTPTDAANTVIPDRRGLLDRLERVSNYMLDGVDRLLARREERVDRLGRSRVLRDARWILGDRHAALERAAARLSSAARLRSERGDARLELLRARLASQAPAARLERAEGRLRELAGRLADPPRRALERRAAKLTELARGLEAVSPLAVLARGYSITRRVADGKPLLRAEEVAKGEELETLLGRGSVRSRVEATRAPEAEA